MTLSELLENQKKLWSPNFEAHKRDIEDLIGFFLEKSWGQLQSSLKIEISPNKLGQIQAALELYRQGRPVAHITGTRFFYKSEFIVNSEVLIPRPETEILVEKCLDILSGGSQTIFDFGAGSGCIGLSIAKELPNGKVHLFEKSPEALAICKQNADKLDLKNVRLHLADLNSPNFLYDLKETADLIVANPPYIRKGDPRVQSSVNEYEPSLALYCQDDGLELPKKWIQTSFRFLKPQGHYLFEFGQGQEIPLSDFIASTDYSIIEKIPDYAGIDRFFKLKKE